MLVTLVLISSLKINALPILSVAIHDFRFPVIPTAQRALPHSSGGRNEGFFLIGVKHTELCWVGFSEVVTFAVFGVPKPNAVATGDWEDFLGAVGVDVD